MGMEKGEGRKGETAQGQAGEAPSPPPGHTDCRDKPPNHFSGEDGLREEMGQRKANTLSYKLYCTCAKAR